MRIIEGAGRFFTLVCSNNASVILARRMEAGRQAQAAAVWAGQLVYTGVVMGDPG